MNLSLLLKGLYRIRYLGVVFDENLSWKEQINQVRAKSARGVGIMCRLKNLLPYCALKSLYISLVQSHFDYASIIFLNTFKSNVTPLQIIQNKAVRILKPFLPSPSNFPLKSTTETLFSLHNILPVRQSIQFLSVMFKIKLEREKLPRYFASMGLISSPSSSQVETRGKYNLRTPKVVTERSRFCLRYLIPLHWERLKNEIDFNVSIDAIRRKLKRVLIESYKSK